MALQDQLRAEQCLTFTAPINKPEPNTVCVMKHKGNRFFESEITLQIVILTIGKLPLSLTSVDLLKDYDKWKLFWFHLSSPQSNFYLFIELQI